MLNGAHPEREVGRAVVGLERAGRASAEQESLVLGAQVARRHRCGGGWRVGGWRGAARSPRVAVGV